MITMPRRTAWQDHRLNAYAEREMVRERTQEIPCDHCGAPAGSACVNSAGEPLLKLDHPRRIVKAERAGRANE